MVWFIFVLEKKECGEQRRGEEGRAQREVTATATASSEGNLILFDFSFIRSILTYSFLNFIFPFHILLFHFSDQIQPSHFLRSLCFLLHTAMPWQIQNFRFHVCVLNPLSDIPNQGIVMFWFCSLRCCRWLMIKIWVSLPIFLASSSLCWW